MFLLHLCKSTQDYVVAKIFNLHGPSFQSSIIIILIPSTKRTDFIYSNSYFPMWYCGVGVIVVLTLELSYKWMGIMAERVELPLGTPTYDMNTIWCPSCNIFNPSPCDHLEKEVDDCPSLWIPAIHAEDTDEVYFFLPSAYLRSNSFNH